VEATGENALLRALAVEYVGPDDVGRDNNVWKAQHVFIPAGCCAQLVIEYVLVLSGERMGA
jgi:hypothetical protein